LKISEEIHLIGSGEIRLSNPLDCHVYLLHDEEGLAMIDAGSGRDPKALLANIRKDGFDPGDVKYLFLTHCHADHAAGGSAIRDLTSCEVITSVEETPYIEHGSEEELGLDVCKKAKWYPEDFTYAHCNVDRSISNGDIIALGKSKIKALIIPGHSYGVLCLLVEFGGRTAFFSSDVVFLGGSIGLGNWPGCSLGSYRENVSRVKGLGVDELYPGHHLWTVAQGQEHLNKAADNLTYGWIPPIGSHNHPVY
jgi:hydroxyacylglutathione hydrolase